ncbi:MAG: hypothetical protein AB8H80_01285 [Planctomycetota bacterium]
MPQHIEPHASNRILDDICSFEFVEQCTRFAEQDLGAVQATKSCVDRRFGTQLKRIYQAAALALQRFALVRDQFQSLDGVFRLEQGVDPERSAEARQLRNFLVAVVSSRFRQIQRIERGFRRTSI